MMKAALQVNMLEAKNQLSKLVRAAAAGTDVVIARNGKPMAKPVGIRPVRHLGGSRSVKLSQARIDAAFSKTLDDEIARSFRGNA